MPREAGDTRSQGFDMPADEWFNEGRGGQLDRRANVLVPSPAQNDYEYTSASLEKGSDGIVSKDRQG